MIPHSLDKTGAIRLNVTLENQTADGKLILPNISDGTSCVLACKNVDGVAVLYLVESGNVRVKNGQKQIENDDTGLWHTIYCQTVDGESVIVLSDVGEA